MRRYSTLTLLSSPLAIFTAISIYGILSMYPFLGDIMDRGEFSLETVSVRYLLNAAFPLRVFVVPGNSRSNSRLCVRPTSSAAKSPRDIHLAYLWLEPGDIQGVSVRPIQAFAAPDLRALVWSDRSDSLKDFAHSPCGRIAVRRGSAARVSRALRRGPPPQGLPVRASRVHSAVRRPLGLCVQCFELLREWGQN